VGAICFDLFTLFDPRSIDGIATAIVGPRAAELCDAWRRRQFEYAWLRASAGQYAPFDVVTEEALVFAARAQQVTLREADRRVLVNACSELTPWPDTASQLAAFKKHGLRLATLSNYSPPMIEHLLAHSGLRPHFDALISTDQAKTFKPDPRAYALGLSMLGLSRQEIVFAAFGGWDAAGAKWFGYPTFWVNRLGVPQEALPATPDDSGPTLTELGNFAGI
jgi:2-haloacid dehalogenase